ncbi:MAG: hypothetical protein ABSB82_07455 [Terriglobia bacterium]|jgi:hypothetical protein
MRNFRWPRRQALMLPGGAVTAVLLYTADLYAQSQAVMKIDLERAIQIALGHNHALKAAQTQIDQSKAEEIAAAIRPNPVFTYDDPFIPIFSPDQFTADTLNNVPNSTGAWPGLTSGAENGFKSSRPRPMRPRPERGAGDEAAAWGHEHTRSWEYWRRQLWRPRH